MVQRLESACQCWGHGFSLWSGKMPRAGGSEARAPQVLSPCLRRETPPQREAQHCGWRSVPRSPQLEKAGAQPRTPSAAKNKQINTQIKKKISASYERPCTYEFENLDEMENFNKNTNYKNRLRKGIKTE